ncbi:hypothetical protein DFP72DRAFT_1069402 [Ephemerocybe angulata]|uniref:MYND-type domain-containing protein n=1 Tax=Ephemerocybe angulata TaxID=980116 RepID=A0A8H6HV58_9AGAR|nr:hypothetical protein DFP72DRAFT_1069402 [Tulosesus angulatus]
MSTRSLALDSIWVSSSLLESAKLLTPSGVDSLQRLCKLTTRVQNYSLNVLEVFLHHTRPELLDLPTELDSIQASILLRLRAHAALISVCEGLTPLLADFEDIPRQAGLKQATIKKILRNLDGILLWLQHNLLNTDYKVSWSPSIDIDNPSQICRAIMVLANYHTTLDQAINSSDIAPRIAIAAFNLQDSNGKPFASFKLHIQVCPIVRLLLQFARHSPQREELIETLGGYTEPSKMLRAQLVEAAVGRAEFVARADRLSIALELRAAKQRFTGTAPVLAAIFYLDDLQDVVSHLCTRDPVILEAFLRSRYPTALIRALERWMSRHGGNNLSDEDECALWLPGLSVLRKGIELLKSNGGAQRVRHARAVRKMVEAGLAALFMEGISNVKRTEHHARECQLLMSLISELEMHSVHPGLSQKLKSIMTGSPGPIDSFHPSQGNEGYWEILVENATSFSDQSLKFNANYQLITLCDNMNCPAQRGAVIPTSRQSRSCSGCHVVLYCSPACQKIDWEEQHRLECRSARAGFRDATAVECSHRLRQLYTMVTLHRANLIYGRWEANAREFYNTGHGPILMMMDLRRWANAPAYTFQTYPYHRLVSPMIGGGFINATGVLKQGPNSTIGHHGDGRVGKIWQEHISQGGRAKGLRIVEGLYRIGDKVVFNMLKLRPSTPFGQTRNYRSDYELVASVTRTVHSPEPPYEQPSKQGT